MATVLISTAIMLWMASLNGGNTAANCAQCDAGWYQRIAEQGYAEIPPGGDLGHWRGADIHQTEWAFFPLYPFLVRGVMAASGLAFPQAALLLGLLLTVVLALLALRFFRETAGTDVALWSTLALLLQPFGIYFHLGMTEALFLCALLGALLSVRRGNTMGLIIGATLLVLTRPNGIYLLPVLVAYQIGQNGGGWSDLWKKPLSTWGRSWPLIFPVLAYAAWCGYQWAKTGTPFASLAAQAGWDRGLTWPWAGFFNAGDQATQFDSWFTIGLIMLAFAMRKRLPFAFNLFLWISILLPLFSGSVASMPRFSTILFPLFILAGQFLAHHRFRWAILGVSFLVQLGWFRLWLNGDLITC